MVLTILTNPRYQSDRMMFNYSVDGRRGMHIAISSNYCQSYIYSMCMSLYPMYLPSVVVVVDVGMGVSVVDAEGLSVVVGASVGSSLCTV